MVTLNPCVLPPRGTNQGMSLFYFFPLSQFTCGIKKTLTEGQKIGLNSLNLSDFHEVEGLQNDKLTK